MNKVCLGEGYFDGLDSGHAAWQDSNAANKPQEHTIASLILKGTGYLLPSNATTKFKKSWWRVGRLQCHLQEATAYTAARDATQRTFNKLE